MTATLISDSQIGLPIDAVFSDKLESYRREGKRIAEVSMLAFDSSADANIGGVLNTKRLLYLVQMFRLILSAARSESIDFLCIKIHPRHAPMYEKLMFEDFGEIRNNPLVKNMSVTGKILDIAKAVHFCDAPENAKSFACSSFFASPKDNACLPDFSERYQFTEEDLIYFFCEKKPIFQNLSPLERSFFELLYPNTECVSFQKNVV